MTAHCSPHLTIVHTPIYPGHLNKLQSPQLHQELMPDIAALGTISPTPPNTVTSGPFWVKRNGQRSYCRQKLPKYSTPCATYCEGLFQCRLQLFWVHVPGLWCPAEVESDVVRHAFNGIFRADLQAASSSSSTSGTAVIVWQMTGSCALPSSTHLII